MERTGPERYSIQAYMRPETRALLEEMARQDGESISGALRSLIRQEAAKRGILQYAPHAMPAPAMAAAGR